MGSGYQSEPAYGRTSDQCQTLTWDLVSLVI